MTGMDFAGRRARLAAQLAAEDLTALLVTDLINIRYLTGFTGSNAALLVDATGDEKTLFCTDGRYVTQSDVEVPDLTKVIDRACDAALLRRATGSMGFEAAAVTVQTHTGWAQSDSPATLTPTTGLVERLRSVKDELEIDALRQACAVADRAFAELIAAGGVRTGRSEREIGLDLDQRMRLLGAREPSFETIVATGANSAIPHHRPTETLVQTGDFVKFDFGAEVDGYHSDMTRTVVVGAPAPWQREIFDLVAAAQTAGRDACRPGVTGGDVDAAARDLITEAGYGDNFGHGLGHGVGLEIHEAPGVARGATGILAENMCVTVEPGVYLPGRGGVRIEDSGVIRTLNSHSVSDAGSAYEVLTLTSKELLQL